MTNCGVRNSAESVIDKLPLRLSPIQVMPPVTLTRLLPDITIDPGPLAPTIKLPPPVLLKVPPLMFMVPLPLARPIATQLLTPRVPPVMFITPVAVFWPIQNSPPVTLTVPPLKL